MPQYRPNLVAWIDSFLSDRTFSVRIGSTDSSTRSIASGVIQGSILGPALFTIFINDIAAKVRTDEVDLEIYADDTKLFSYDPLLLQKALHQADDWCAENDIHIAPEKCSVLSVSRSLPSVPCSLTIDNVPINQVTRVKDLGVILNSQLSPVDHIRETSQKAARRMNLVLRSLRSKDI